MKYLKKFESKSEDEVIKEDIEDILLNLKDLGCETEVNLGLDLFPFISVSFLLYHGQPAKWSVIEDEFLRVLDLTKDKYIIDIVYYKEVQPNGRIFNRGNRDTLELDSFLDYMSTKNAKLAHLSITMYKNTGSKWWY